MTNPSSALVDYYPKDFQVDANGKKNSWECIVKIPFINEEILLDSVNEIDHAKQLTTLERQRNIMGLSHRFKPPSWVNGVHSAKRTVERRPEGWGSALVPDGRKGGYSNQKYNNLKSNNGSPPNARKVYNPKST